MHELPDHRLLGSRTHRVITAALGLLFVVLAVLIIVFSDTATGIGPLFAALLVGGLGFEAIVSAIRNKPSLLSRIGPLP